MLLFIKGLYAGKIACLLLSRYLVNINSMAIFSIFVLALGQMYVKT